MMNYDKLVAALRECGECVWCNECPIFDTCDGDMDRAMHDAADAIEALQAEVDAMKHDIERYVGINAELTTENEALQAEVKILKVSGREAYFEGLAVDDKGRQVEKLAKRNAELHAELERWVSAAEKAGEPKRGEIVRCGQCKYNGRCMLQSFVRDNAVEPITDDWFCADGERRISKKEDGKK